MDIYQELYKNLRCFSIYQQNPVNLCCFSGNKFTLEGMLYFRVSREWIAMLGRESDAQDYMQGLSLYRISKLPLVVKISIIKVGSSLDMAAMTADVSNATSRM